jgi:hypothetical protein
MPIGNISDSEMENVEESGRAAIHRKLDLNK